MSTYTLVPSLVIVLKVLQKIRRIVEIQMLKPCVRIGTLSLLFSCGLAMAGPYTYTTVTTELDFFGGGAVGTPYTDLEYLAVPSFTGPGTLTGISIGLTATLGQNNDIIYSPTGTFRLPISPDTVRIPHFISTTHPTMELSRKRQTCRSTSWTAAALLPALVARRA